MTLKVYQVIIYKMAKGSDNLLWVGVGSMVSVIADYVWQSVHLPGWNTIIGGVSSKQTNKTAPITAADWMQIVGTASLGLYAQSEGGAGNKIDPFTFGAFMTQIITKYGFPTAGIPRYIFLDIDAQGRLVPAGQFRF